MSTDADTLALEAWVTTALGLLAPAARKKLFREIGLELRRRTRARMARQTDPDGAAWPARRRQGQQRSGKVAKMAKMMQGLREIRRLQLTATPDGVALGWHGRHGQIASVHQTGELDYVDRSQSTLQVRYPIRRLIGLPAGDMEFVRARLLDHLSQNLG